MARKLLLVSLATTFLAVGCVALPDDGYYDGRYDRGYDRTMTAVTILNSANV